MSGGLRCPFCGSVDVELVAAWGGQLITSAVRCRACNTHFEALRSDLAQPDDEVEAAPPWTSS